MKKTCLGASLSLTWLTPMIALGGNTQSGATHRPPVSSGYSTPVNDPMQSFDSTLQTFLEQEARLRQAETALRAQRPKLSDHSSLDNWGDGMEAWGEAMSAWGDKMQENAARLRGLSNAYESMSARDKAVLRARYPQWNFGPDAFKDRNNHNFACR